MATDPHQQAGGFRAVLAWALFLGCSWTWCIGMFLPVLLVRDMGLAGWIVFAVPNVLGAAAMGWVLRTAAASRRLQQRHQGACLAFSLVTVAFHIYFAWWLIGHRLLEPRWFMAVWLGAVLLWLMGRRNWKHDLPAAALIWLLSLATFQVVVGPLSQGSIPALPAATGPKAWQDALFLSPVCLLGFTLCPYFDLTFHRARQELSPAAARWAFSIGFGVVFLAMILYSLIYAGPLGYVLAHPHDGRMPRIFAVILGVHLAGQIAFTLAVHTRELLTFYRPHDLAQTLLGWITILGPIGLGALVGRPQQWFGMDNGELVYRMFMCFYGLIFPAYGWLIMVPRRDGRRVVRVKALWVLAITVAIASPMYWMGFILNHMVWLIPGAAVVILARWFIPTRTAL